MQKRFAKHTDEEVLSKRQKTTPANTQKMKCHAFLFRLYTWSYLLFYKSSLLTINYWWCLQIISVDHTNIYHKLYIHMGMYYGTWNY